MSELKDLLRFPDLNPVDHPRHCQQYTNILCRTTEESISVDEIDNLQMDLETLLAAASSRMRQLHAEIQSLSDSGEVKKEKRKDFEPKRSKTQDERPSKKLKSSDSSSYTKYPHPGTSGGSVGRPKAKGTPTKVQEQDVQEEQTDQPACVPVNDAPNKFWQSVEAYCKPIDQDTVKMLEQMCQSQLDHEDFYKIPQLGVHFSERWALEDMREEQSEGSRANGKKCDKNDDTVHTVLKKANDTLESSAPSPYGALTQRLISAFVEENIMVPPDRAASMVESGKTFDQSLSGPDGGTTTMRPMKPISVMHSHKLENRIKAELIEQGILDPDPTDSKQSDEILNELESCQQELKAVSKQNHDILQQLLQAAKQEMKRQEIRKKIDTANVEVMEHYRKVMSARQKKRTLLKKEKDSAWKALRDREALIKQLSNET